MIARNEWESISAADLNGAECVNVDAEVFGEKELLAEARAICEHCPVLVECGKYAYRIRADQVTMAGLWWTKGKPAKRQ